MDKLSASEALFGFMGWLTSFKNPVTFSGSHEAGIAAELVDEFCKANNLSKPRDGWYLNLVHPTNHETAIAPEIITSSQDAIKSD